MPAEAVYPSGEHRRAAEAVVGFFSGQDVDAVLISPDEPKMFHVKHLWEQFHESQEVFQELGRRGSILM